MAPHVTRILVPTDFSETADAALEYAKTLATDLGASLHLLHVFQDPDLVTPFASEVYAPPPPALRVRELAAATDGLLKRMSPEDEKRFAGTHAIVEGLTAKEIVKYAEQYAIDLIVMGTHGRRGVAHLLLGSVAEHVGRIAPCPVLTVRDPQNAASKPAEPTSPTARVA